MSPTFKHFVFDGPPGAGKTTLLSGKSHDQSTFVFNNPLSSLRVPITIDPVLEVFGRMIAEGRPPRTAPDEAIRALVDSEVSNFSKIPPGDSLFHDRGFLGFIRIGERIGATNLDIVREAAQKYRYADPVFIFEPLASCDLSNPTDGRKTRIYTYEERVNFFDWAREEYTKFGYQVCVLPALDKDPSVSCAKRMTIVMDLCKLAIPSEERHLV